MRSWRDLVEGRIRAAREAGIFDRLRGRGEPLPDDGAAGLPADARMDARVAASVGGMPAEVDRMRAVRELEAALVRETDPAKRAGLRRALRDARIELNVLLERTGRAVLLAPGRRDDE